MPKKPFPTSAQLRAARELAETIADKVGADVRTVEKAMRGDTVRGAAGQAIAVALLRSGFTTEQQQKEN